MSQHIPVVRTLTRRGLGALDHPEYVPLFEHAERPRTPGSCAYARAFGSCSNTMEYMNTYIHI